MVRHPLWSALALLAALTVILTWPQALHLDTRVPGHDDPLFSIWRLAWIAHVLPTDPSHLFDANIYYPHARTLAFSDAMLFEGIVAAPFLWAGVSPVLVYNLMFLAGIVSSGLGMFVLARYLTGDTGAGLVAAVVFTLAPYRIEHLIHLELQWTVWMPLTLWMLHRTIDEGAVRFGALTGLFLWLQIISCVYYGAFLGLIAGALALLLMASRPRLARRALGPLCLGAVLAVILTLPYALPYLANTHAFGPRPASDVGDFSAHWDSYLVAPYQNWLWGGRRGNTAGTSATCFRGRPPSFSRWSRSCACRDGSCGSTRRSHSSPSSCRLASTARSTSGSTITSLPSADSVRRRVSQSSRSVPCRFWPASASSICSACSPHGRREGFCSRPS